MEGVNILDVTSDLDIGNSLQEIIESAEVEYGVIHAEHVDITEQLLSNTDLSKAISKLRPLMSVIAISFEAHELTLNCFGISKGNPSTCQSLRPWKSIIRMR